MAKAPPGTATVTDGVRRRLVSVEFQCAARAARWTGSSNSGVEGQNRGATAFCLSLAHWQWAYDR
jgi:hypothetical protein